MRYNEQINIKLYTFTNNSFVKQAIIDDFQEISFSHNLYEAGDFTISINYNIPNALKFERGLFVQFGDNPYMFGEILKITDAIGEDGKGSQIRTITGKDARYIFKRRIIKNLNNVENWIMTDKGELCLRNLIKDQCGSGAESKRQLPIINTIPASADAIGKEYSVAESFSNLYDTLVTIATQSEIGWRVKFNGSLTLECYEGSDLSDSVQFSTDFDSLSNGQFTDSAEAYANSIYVGGKGTGAERDIYEGESAIGGSSPAGFDRYEAWDNQSSMTSESEYEAEALSMLNQYGQTVTIDGQGLAKCPYEFQKQYNIGDVITLAFSGKSAKAQILSVTEHWIFGQYGIEFTFGKPQNDFSRQMQLILKQIQKASVKTTVTESVKWYTMTSNQTQDKADVIYDSIGFTGAIGTGKTFTFYWDSEKTGAKTYNIYGKALSGTGKLTLKSSATNKASITLETGTYVASIYVDAEGNVVLQSCTATSTVSSGNSQPVTSGGVYDDSFLLREEVNNDIDNYPIDGVRIYRVTGKTIGWLYNDGFIINLPWSNANFGTQIALDDQSNWLAIRTKNQGSWGNWSRIIDEELLNKIELVSNADANTCYPSENNKIGYYQGIFASNAPITTTRQAILKSVRTLREDASYTEIYQEYETFGISSIGNYTPRKFIRYGRYTSGSVSSTPTWSDWAEIIRNYDLNPSWVDTGILSSSLGAIKYKKIGSLVALHIISKGGSLKITTNGGAMKKVVEGVETIVYLPEEIRPTAGYPINFALIDNTFDTVFHARIQGNGTIIAWNNTLKNLQDVNSWNLSIVYSI